ncbi:hypothetical protein JHK85_002631 [Glycine max]|nr:hypothetical protein JHK85_002631 [Glycine max]
MSIMVDLSSVQIQSRYGSANKESSFKRSTSETTLERLSDLFGQAEGSSNPPKMRRNASASANISSLASQSNPTNSAPQKHITSWPFDEKLLIQTLYKEKDKKEEKVWNKISDVMER